MSELIHFAHGNGFPSPCYSQLLNNLAITYECCYIDKIGHNPYYPVSDNWPYLVAELIAHIKSQATYPVIAVGHSLGGVLSLMAAIDEPSLFKAVILLDSPLIGPLKSNMVRLAKTIGMIDRITPAHRTKGRREHWRTKQDVIAYLKTRDLFKTFSEECLDDYVTYGLEKKDDEYYLRFDRHIEYNIYRTIPHIIPKLQGQLKVPAALIYGDQSGVVKLIDRQYMLNHFGIRSYKTKGTHLFPMEHPKAVAEQIIDVIDDLLSLE